MTAALIALAALPLATAQASPTRASPAVVPAPDALRSDPLGGPAAVAGRQVISGSMFYPRIPRALWRDRLKKARAMGLNTIETYAFWNVHEPRPGHFDFSGQNDIAEFVREAAEEGLMVVVRPGPYACAEWDWGGLPSWLNRDPKMQVRTLYPGFMKATQRYLDALARQLAPLQATRGGPIIGVQVENEYGSYGEDHAYMRAMKDAFVRAGFAPRLLFTADGPDLLARGALPDLPVALNFAPGSAKGAVEALAKFRPGAPVYVGEYWDGWFDHWGERHETRDGTAMAEELRTLLASGASVNLYMFTGGTSFGWMAGANSAGANADHTNRKEVNYQPDVTSYDYDSPLSEAGRPTPKFFAFRDAIQSVTGETLPALPPESPTIALPPMALGEGARDAIQSVTGETLPALPPESPTIALPPMALGEGASLWSDLPKPVRSSAPLTMEDIGQSFGYILYRTTIAKGSERPATLTLPVVHDYAAVYVDGVLQGVIDRRLQQTSLTLAPLRAGARLSILVENSGRVNYGPALPDERAGIIGTPLLDGVKLLNWENFALPMSVPPAAPVQSASPAAKPPCTGPCFSRAQFTLSKVGDTFLDTGALGKGVAWVNGHNVGRFWQVGPQRTLYLPAPFLKTGRNEIVVFDLTGGEGRHVEGLRDSILDAEPAPDPVTSRLHLQGKITP
ncbi:glycoside hydrolase family 35 protein [Novosphingobium organovorum]